MEELFVDIKEEMIDGKIYNMAPVRSNHSMVVINIGDIIKKYLLEKGKDCIVSQDNLDLHIDDKTYVTPDIMVICDKTRFIYEGYNGVPELVVEVLSKSTVKLDRVIKFKKYCKLGIKEYWIVHPEDKILEQYVIDNNEYNLLDVYYIELIDKEGFPKSKREFNANVFEDLKINLFDVFKNVLDYK